MRSRGAARFLQRLIIGPWAAVGLFIGRDDMDAAPEPRLILLRNIRARRAIDDDRVRNVVRLAVVREFFEVERFPGRGESRGLALQID